MSFRRGVRSKWSSISIRSLRCKDEICLFNLGLPVTPELFIDPVVKFILYYRISLIINKYFKPYWIKVKTFWLYGGLFLRFVLHTFVPHLNLKIEGILWTINVEKQKKGLYHYYEYQFTEGTDLTIHLSLSSCFWQKTWGWSTPFYFTHRFIRIEM